MRANLAQKEPDIIKKWEQMNLYQKIRQVRKNSPSFVLHDGPPYANGSIHLGTALNKVLKDFIIKSKNMQGFNAPYIPGWDCHGLPIEKKVDEQLGVKKNDMSIIDIREKCKAYALRFVDLQRSQFKRLGVFGEWNAPYLTMNPQYEGEILRHLAAFFASGNVYKGKKPVYWCAECCTALAEAEIEYKDRASPSIFVKFSVLSDMGEQYPELKGKKIFILIWTTTPWTLPANLAIAFHPDFEYAAFETGREVYIAASRLVPVLTEALGVQKVKILATFPGKDMEGLKARHPFIERESVFVLADYVTLDQGTGAVHTAPGHGQEDYLTGIKYGLDIYTPVDDKGRFAPEVKKYGGINVFDSNQLIVEDMAKEGSLLKTETIVHSYPHCWRCKKPVIFRATSQWFISMDNKELRKRVLEEIKNIRWIPYWGEERISNMIVARPDWCISRQRSWGVPIPAFYCQKCGSILADERTTLWVADIFSKEGSNSWFLQSPDTLLPPGSQCPQCGSDQFDKENNILDVWFESGGSHNILGKKHDLPWPADIYIEGHDQYRGWFNSSLLIGVEVKNRSPYKTCITHGFVLDEEGRGMSKSLGNVIEPDKIIEANGAEILRLWIAMLNYKEDAKFSHETLQRLVEAYRKIRNTWRFILGNIHDFVPDKESLSIEDMESFDRWILERASQLGKRVLKAYEDFEYHIVFHTVYNFFTVDLSAYYLDVLKDRLYCSGEDSQIRKSAQTALFQLLKTTLLLMAPILPFTTDEVWELMPEYKGKFESVHLMRFPGFREEWLEKENFQEWTELGQIRETVLKELEIARESKLIGNSLEAEVTMHVPSSLKKLLHKYKEHLASLFIVSAVKLEQSPGEELQIHITKVKWEKCVRCWNYSTHVGTSKHYPDLCERCENIVQKLNP